MLTPLRHGSRLALAVIAEIAQDGLARAVQLSHNAISGQDEPSLLSRIWAEMDLDAKKYSGLTDDDIADFDEIKIEGFSAGSLKYESMELMFLPEDADDFVAIKERIENSKAAHKFSGRLEDFDAFFEAIVTTKHKLDISNSAMALLAMAELARERLEQLEQDDEHSRETEAE